MNTKKTLLIIAVLGFFISTTNAQTNSSWRSGKQVNDTYHHNWSFGAGVNIVDDGNQILGGIGDPNKYWNFSRPFYISAEYYLNNMFSFTSMVSINQYKADKQIDGVIILDGHEASYFAFDLGSKYYFRDLIKTYKFDPYVFLGFGFTNIGKYQGKAIDKYYPGQDILVVPSIGRMTINGGPGLNVWFSQTWGLNLNLAGKWGIATGDHEKKGNDISNQKQYSLGVIYFLNN